MAIAVTAAIAFAGCGDDSSSSAGGSTNSTGPTNGGTAASSTDAPTSTAKGGTASTSSGLAPGAGFIQIGDLRHELKIELCASVLGSISGRAVGVSEPDKVKVVFNISPENWKTAGATFKEPGSIQYSEALANSWTTGQKRYIDDYKLPAGIDPSTIAISSYDIADDAKSVTGTATFYDLNALVYATPVAPKTGSFAFACPPS
jgi:hypothetical protein